MTDHDGSSGGNLREKPQLLKKWNSLRREKTGVEKGGQGKQRAFRVRDRIEQLERAASFQALRVFTRYQGGHRIRKNENPKKKQKRACS